MNNAQEIAQKIRDSIRTGNSELLLEFVKNLQLTERQQQAVDMTLALIKRDRTEK